MLSPILATAGRPDIQRPTSPSGAQARSCSSRPSGISANQAALMSLSLAVRPCCFITRSSEASSTAQSAGRSCLVTDAGAGRAPIARRRTLAASTAGAAGWAVRTLASPCEAGGGGVALSGLDRAVQRACSAPAGWPHARERLRARLDTAALCWALSASAACSGSGTADPRWGRPFSGSAQGRRAIIRPIHPTSEGVP